MCLLVALDFGATNSDATINDFRERQILRLGRIAADFEADTIWRYSFSPEFLRPATMTPHVALGAQLAEFLELNARGRHMQSVAGFSIAGNLSRRFTFPIDLPRRPPPVDPEGLFASQSGRFVHRARMAPGNFDAALWMDAIAQVELGRLTNPALLSADCNFASCPSRECDIAFRLGLPQDDMLRGRDDLGFGRQYRGLRPNSHHASRLVPYP